MGYNTPSAPALNDSFETCQFQIQPGTYTLYAISITYNNRGLITWYVDDDPTPVGTMDLYSTSSVTAVLSTPSIYFPPSTNNVHKLKAVVSKNGSSSGYFIYLGLMWFK
jgi:hypothetical protein